MKICSLINELLRKKDKVNKKYLSLLLNEENKYRDRYIKKEIMKKILATNISERKSKKSLSKNENLSQKNIYKTNNNKILKKSQSIPDFRKIKNNKAIQANTNNINKKGGLYNEFLNKFITKNSIIKGKNNLKKPNNKNKYKINYINYINNRNNSKSNLNSKIKISEVNKTIKYFKLNKRIKNNNNVDLTLKIKNNLKNEKNKNIRSFIEENNIICGNGNFSLKKSKQNINDIKKKLFLIRQSNEQFSMNSYRAKSFSKLCPIDNIFFNYCPTLNNINNNDNISKIYITNFSICSNQVEYNAISNPKPERNLIQKDNKNVIININQISQISPKIKIIQNDNNIDNIINNKKDIISKENDLISAKQKYDKHKIINIDKNKNDMEKNNKNKKNENTFDNKNGQTKNNNIIVKKQDINNNVNNSKENLDKNKNESEEVPLNTNNIEKKVKNNNKNLGNDIIKDEINPLNNNDNKERKHEKENEMENNKNGKIIMNYHNNEYEIKIKEEIDINDKKSKQFLRFKARLIKKVGNEIQKDGDKYHISAKIIKMASKLEEQIGKSGPEKDNSNIEKKKNNIELENNENNIIDIIEKKPKSFKKKKSTKVEFSGE